MLLSTRPEHSPDRNAARDVPRPAAPLNCIEWSHKLRQSLKHVHGCSVPPYILNCPPRDVLPNPFHRSGACSKLRTNKLFQPRFGQEVEPRSTLGPFPSQFPARKTGKPPVSTSCVPCPRVCVHKARGWPFPHSSYPGMILLALARCPRPLGQAALQQLSCGLCFGP